MRLYCVTEYLGPNWYNTYVPLKADAVKLAKTKAVAEVHMVEIGRGAQCTALFANCSHFNPMNFCENKGLIACEKVYPTTLRR